MWLNVFCVRPSAKETPWCDLSTVNFRRNFPFFVEKKNQINGGRERRKSCQVKFPCYFHLRILKEFLLSFWLFCATEERRKCLSLSQTGGFKNTLRLSCRNFVLKSILSNFFCSTKSAEQIYSNTCHMCMRNDSGFSFFEFISVLLRSFFLDDEDDSLENEIKTLEWKGTYQH